MSGRVDELRAMERELVRTFAWLLALQGWLIVMVVRLCEPASAWDAFIILVLTPTIFGLFALGAGWLNDWAHHHG